MTSQSFEFDPNQFQSSDTDLTFVDPGLFSLEHYGPSDTPSILELLNSFLPIMVVAFIVTVITVPIARYIAVKNGVVDRPDGGRKRHAYAVAYLGGLAVFAGVLGGIISSYLYNGHGIIVDYPMVPIAVVLGMFAIVITGAMDDIWGWDPRLKIAGQLIAAAGLVVSDVGTQTAQGLLQWFLQPEEGQVFLSFVPVSWYEFFGDINVVSMSYFAPTYAALYYWVGVILIAVLVIGACNAANLIDGLDGLLTGSTSIMAVGFTAIALMMAIHDASVYYSMPEADMGEWDALAGTRLVLSLSLLGATLGFLPYNFSPAVIFLGDAGSLLLGYICAVLILSLGSEGNTQLVIAGLIVFGLPIMDTLLAILRRKMAGLPMSAPDSNHIHHMVFRAAGSVPRAVVLLYLLTTAFMVLGVALVVLSLLGEIRLLAIYSVAVILFLFVAAMAFKTAQRHRWMTETLQNRAREVNELAKSEENDRPRAAG